ncbi:MAG: hypothetical protein IJZ07_01845 [Clostridia bacterium]|nr:hypothetical protein [Clostridia bacterium]
MHSRIKLSARLALSGAHLKILPLLTLIIFSVFVFSLCNSAINTFIGAKHFSVAFSVLSLLAFAVITAPARLRLEIKHLMLAKGKFNSDSAKLGFSGTGKALLFYSVLFCLKSFWLAAFEAVPATALWLFVAYLKENSVSVKASYVVSAAIAFLALSGFVFYLIFIQRYSKSAFYLACYKDFGIFDAIGESIRKTEGRLTDILLFKLGFLPWILLCLGIVPMLFVIPYYKQSLMCYFLN